MMRVELRLPPKEDPTALPPLVSVHKGQQLSKRLVRQSIERLFATGRFADVVVTLTSVEGGVQVAFDLSPVRKVASVSSEGNTVLPTFDIVFAAKLNEGSEFYPERLQEAKALVLEAYRRSGYRHAVVTASVTDGQGPADIVFHLVEGTPTRLGSLSVAGGPGLPIRKVVKALGLNVGGVLDETALAAGVEALKALYRQEHFYRAQVGTPVVVEAPEAGSGSASASVNLPVDAGPRFVFRFEGNRSFSDATLQGVLHYDPAESLDRSIIARLARRVATFYEYRGFHHVSVEPRPVLSADGSRATLVFQVAEGPLVLVRTLVFDGNRAVGSATLKELVDAVVKEKEPVPVGDVHPTDDPVGLAGRTQRAPREEAPRPLGGDVFVEDAYREAAEGMQQLYRARGYLSAKVALQSVRETTAPRALEVHFSIFEGPRARVRDVSYRGVPVGLVLYAGTTLGAGMPFSDTALDEGRTLIIRSIGRAGYLFAKVQVESTLSDDGENARVVFKIDSGPRVSVGQVIVRGIVRTHEELIRRNVSLRTGDLLSPDELLESQRALVLLGIFRQVAVRLIAPDTVEGVKDVVVEVKELPRLVPEVNVGYSLADGPRVAGVLTLPNFFGQGISLTARAQVNYVLFGTLALIDYTDEARRALTNEALAGVDGRFNIALHDARIYNLLPAQLGARLDLVGERVHRPAYTYSRFAAISGVDWTARKWLTLSVQDELENDHVNAYGNIENILVTGNPIDAQRLRFPEGNFVLNSVVGSATLDLRDDPVNPHAGLLIAASAEYTRNLELGFLKLTDSLIDTLKFSGKVTGYVPFGRRVVLAVSVWGGRIYLLDPTSQTFGTKRFFLGGATSLRGFAEDGVLPADQRAQLASHAASCRAIINGAGCDPLAQAINQGKQVPSQGGNLFTLAKAELRFPVVGDFDGAVFGEAGNLWLSPLRYRPFELRYVAGLGARYVTPVGPLALDFAVNLLPDKAINEPSFQVQFSVGLF